MNANILHDKFGNEKMSHSIFRERIAKFLLESSSGNVNENNAAIVDDDSTSGDDRQLQGKHFLEPIPKKIGNRSVPLICFQGKILTKSKGLQQQKKSTSFCCNKCLIVMYIHLCFHLYHTKNNYHDHV